MSQAPVKLLIMAAHMEAKPFIQGLALNQVARAPVPVFQNRDTVLVISGIGKTNAAMAASYGCLTWSPSVICNLGAAGGVGLNLNVGDVFQISKILEFDRPRLRSEGVFVHRPNLLENIPTAVLATQDKTILEPDQRKMLANHVQLVDMEAAAIVHVCKKFSIPCHVFKFISDTPEHTDGNDIITNIKHHREAFYSWFLEHVTL